MRKDNLFNDEKKGREDFNFGRDTAEVFDDMLLRSVPLYEEVQEMIVELAGNFLKKDSVVYDFGCSTATTILMLGQKYLSRNIKIIGLDYSKSMLDKARIKLTKGGVMENCDLRLQDLNEPLKIPEKINFAVMILTLQFIRPLNRERLIRSIYDALDNNGCFIIVEKILCEESFLNRFFIELYYNYKRKKGYSDLEISTKREALENVLIPYRPSENLSLLRKGGFEIADLFFRWYNFAGFIAIKK